MIVGVVPVGSGVVPVNNQFFVAASEAAGVTAYVNGYTPPKNPANFLGFDTGWGGTKAQKPSPGKQWAYDRTLLSLVEIDLAGPAASNEGINAYDSTGGQTFTGTITVLLDSSRQRPPGTLFTLNAVTGEITANQAIPWAEITYQVSLDCVGSTRTDASHWLEINGVEVPGTRAYSYHRNSAVGEDTGGGSAQIALAQNDVIRVRSQRVTFSGSMVTLASGSRLNVKVL